MNKLPVPRSPDELTTDWFTAALQGESNSANPIEKLEVETIGTGIGLMGGLYRCSLSSRAEESISPSSVVVKISSDDPKSTDVAKMFQLYEKEVMFYRDISPLIQMRVPKVYYSDLNTKDNTFVLVLEDLSHLKVHSQIEGASEEEGRLAIRHLAKFHSRFWGKDQAPPLNSYYSLLQASYTTKIHIGFHNAVPKVLELFDEDLSPLAKGLIRDLGDNLAGHYFEMGQGPRTLTHGDYRLDNMFFGDPGENELVVIDWQTNGIGVGMTDVAYFMVGSLATDVRKQIEREALAEYHEITSSEGGADWTYQECWDAYRKSNIAAMTVPVIAAGELSLDNERAFELIQIGIRRMNDALLELDVGEFSAHKKSVFTKSGFQSFLSNQLSKVVG